MSSAVMFPFLAIVFLTVLDTEESDLTVSVVTIVLRVFALLFLLYLAALRCRAGKEELRKLSTFRYAHRGLHDAAQGIPENSAAAFRRAIAHHFGAELDVHLLRDGSLAVFHDSDLRRMTGCEGIVEELSAQELSSYHLGGTEETIPQLSEVLSLFEGTGLPLVVELKSCGRNYEALARRTMEELDRFHVPYCVESFDPRCLRWLRCNRREVVRGQLGRNFLTTGATGHGRWADILLTHLLCNFLTQPDFIAYRYECRRSISLRLCRRVYGAKVFYWTVRSRADMERAEGEDAAVIFEQFIP